MKWRRTKRPALRTAYQLMVAGVILLIPILIVTVLYLGEKNREIEVLEQQLHKSVLINPLYSLLKEVSNHRGLLNIYLNSDASEIRGQIEAPLIEAKNEIKRQLGLLVRLSKEESVEWRQHVGRVELLWQKLLKAEVQATQQQAEELFQKQGDQNKNILLLLAELDQYGSYYAVLQGTIIKQIPVMIEDISQLRGLSSGYMARMNAGMFDEALGGSYLDAEAAVRRIRHYLTLTLRDFIDLRNMLDRTFVEGFERERAIPLMFDLVTAVQTMEDLIQWDILDGEERSNAPLVFFKKASLSVNALYELESAIEQLYLHRLQVQLTEQRSSRKWIVILLSTSTLIAILLAFTIVRHILKGIQQAVSQVTALGEGDYQIPLNQYEHRHNQSVEVIAMLNSIEQTRGQLQKSAEQTEHAHRKIEEQKNFMKDLTDNMLNGIYALDHFGLVSFINPAAEEMLGYREEELMGKNIHQIIHAYLPDGTYVEAEDCPVHKAILSGARYHVELDWFTCKDGRMIPVEFNTAPLIDEGVIKGSVAVFMDITSRLEMEAELKESVIEADEANRSKSDFLANMSHEIRTPMNAIIGVGYLALKAGLNEQQQSYVKKMHNAALSLLSIINDILDFSKVEAGKIELENIPFRLSKILNNLNHLFLEKMEERGVQLLFIVKREVPDQLVGDPGRVSQVLVNLINNAIKFTEQGVITVAVTLQNEVQSTVANLKFTVEDQGVGMTDSQQQRLFQPFTQADSSTSRKYGGTGLGLAISRQLVELMGGEITVDSQLGRGSCFSFSLPLKVTQQSLETVKTTNTDDTVRQQLSGVRVLLVEDNDVNQMVAIEMLQMAGVEVELAENGEVALQRLYDQNEKQLLFDIVLMDIQMPEMDGYEATRRIRADERFRDLPVVAVTANALIQDQMDAKDAGMDDHIAKPFDPDILYRTIDKWVVKRDRKGVFELNSNGAWLEAKAEKLIDFPWKTIRFSKGYRQMGGSDDVSRAVLSNFSQTQPALMMEARERIEKKEIDQAIHLLNTLQESALTIAAVELPQQLDELESLLLSEKEGKQCDHMLVTVESSLGTIIDEIDLALSGQQGATPNKKIEREYPITPEQLQPLLQLVDSYDMAALDYMVELKTLFTDGVKKPPWCKQLEFALEQYDFEKAKTIIVETITSVDR
ncbi:MAG: response regulator [Gammaproteobacteria bacterium]|jgi:PAS domain S-box-containing protein|nr:response regulator [Gammaproteobacteria bacterium]MBT3489669.1 response regulator [Gammaproteobacteria bacterium]MBT3719271.1 response regulator [Gammaproteobacteria bacterium]MBT3844665.1 response regulator [Gammaproteobacteria bacterium]MBT3892601.1 response regulator [Gammaproteobacteria bacterium]